jgi:hypothetical protein
MGCVRKAANQEGMENMPAMHGSLHEPHQGMHGSFQHPWLLGHDSISRNWT